MARDICKVIDFLIAEVIPQSEHHVIRGVRYIQSKATYTPPEMMASVWGELGYFFLGELGETDENSAEWKKRVGRIMRDEEKVPNSELPERKDEHESK